MTAFSTHVPVLGFAARSGAGKTTLLVKLLRVLESRGIRSGMIKHAHHGFDVDTPGKDSYELRKAGAAQMLVASSRRWALMVEKQPETEPVLRELIEHLQIGSLDLILVEGFKHENFPKIEVHRAAAEHPPLYPEDKDIIAVASDEPLDTSLPVLDLNDPHKVVAFIVERFL